MSRQAFNNYLQINAYYSALLSSKGSRSYINLVLTTNTSQYHHHTDDAVNYSLHRLGLCSNNNKKERESKTRDCKFLY